MFTASEKKCLLLTFAFLAAGAGLKVWREHSAFIGPEPLGADTVASAAPSASFDSAAANRPAAAAPAPADSISIPEPQRNAPAAAAAAHFDSKPAGIRAVASRKASPSGKVPLNRAGVADLTGVPGIGEKTAEAILAYRRAHGDFREVRELLNVKGIGEKKLERMRAFLVISPVDAEEPLRQASLSGTSRR